MDFVVTNNDGVRLGTVTRIADANILQRRGAWVMSQLFESVDDLEPSSCPECETGQLSWDGRRAKGASKPRMRCPSCGWSGLTGTFTPFRELN